MRESQIDHDAAWQILVQRKAKRKETRTAFIAALLVERCREPGGNPLSANMAETFATELARIAMGIRALCEADCNTGLTERQQSRQRGLEERFAAIATALGFEVRTGGDPRGPCAYLIDPDQRRGDGWGEGWAVYR